MTNTPSPDEDREFADLIEALYHPDKRTGLYGTLSLGGICRFTAPVLESLLSDRAKLARRVRRLANHGNCSCAECKELDALNRSTDRE